MNSVIENINEIEIKNSRFITHIYYIETENDVIKLINNIKNEYKDATHYCYAYIIDEIKRENDDGEPGGTAGIPILQVLEKNKLNHVLCIVVRYFGKIKLGAGGLVRAYTKSTTLCLKDHIKILKKGYLTKITFPYSISKTIDYILTNQKILKKEYNDTITYEVIIEEDLLKQLENMNEDININIIKEKYF